MRGKFITFEGTEGVGKSTQLRLLKEYCDNNGINALFIREPGGTKIGEMIRDILLDAHNSALIAESEALLYAACRAQLIDEVILPALESGQHVISDRYIDSSIAYQGYARNLGVDFIKSINRYAIDKCMPDCTILLKLEPKLSFMRKGGADSDDRLELLGEQFHKKVYEGYLKIAETNKDRIVVIEPLGDKYDTHNKIIKQINKTLDR